MAYAASKERFWEEACVGTNAEVMRGEKQRTRGHATQGMLFRNKWHKVVQKDKSDRGGETPNRWMKCCTKARTQVRSKSPTTSEGFVCTPEASFT